MGEPGHPHRGGSEVSGESHQPGAAWGAELCTLMGLNEEFGQGIRWELNGSCHQGCSVEGKNTMKCPVQGTEDSSQSGLDRMGFIISLNT